MCYGRKGVVSLAKGKKGKNQKLEKGKEDKLQAIDSRDQIPLIKTDTIETIMPLNEYICDVADFFKVFGDATRIKMLYLLLEGELCVGDIADKLTMTQSAVSHQLRVLRQNDLVKNRKEGKTVYYSLDDDHVRSVLEEGMHHIGHKRGYST